MEKIKVLIADDSTVVLEVLSSYLQDKEDIEVVGTAEDGLQVMDILRSKPVDVLLLDMVMPRLDGWAPRFDGAVPQPCKFAPEIAGFLGAAHAALPAVARGWKSIDVSDLGSLTLPLLKVVDASGMEIIFAPKDYKKQFGRLEYILRYQRENPLTVIKRIDLSIKGWAPVKIKTTK